MKKPSIPILAWVVLGLTVVGLLPFALTWYQIDRSRDGIISQTQQTHQLLARSSAERVGSRLAVLSNLMAAAGDVPALYQDPTSASAQQVLEQIFAAESAALAIGLYAYRDDQTYEVKLLRRQGESLEPQDYRSAEPSAAPRLLRVDGRSLLRLQRETTRPRLSLVMLVDAADLDLLVTPRGVDEGELALVDGGGQLLAGTSTALAAIPVDKQQAMLLPDVNSGNNSIQRGNPPVVYGFARVPGLDWRVVSSQPAAAAEAAIATMRRTAWQAFAAAAAIVALLSVLAWRFVVRPIRGLVGARRQTVGGGPVSGGEIAQLQATFERLDQALSERDQLSKVFLGRYQVLKRLGSGAMGNVYLAEDLKLKRRAALKTIRISDQASKADQRYLAERLFAEGVTSAGLNHPNVVTVYDVIGDERGAFIAMEFVDGESLEERVDRQLRLSPKAVLEVASGVLKGLRVAHDSGVVHRDVKPGNVLIATDGAVKLTDFGIAAALAGDGDKVVMGTPGYLAPECYARAQYDARTDLFALGVVLVECLTGQAAFPGRHTRQIIARTKNREVVIPPTIAAATPEGLRVLIDRLLEKDPERRPQSAVEALEIIDNIEGEIAATIAELSSSDQAEIRRSASDRRRLSNAPTTRVDTTDIEH